MHAHSQMETIPIAGRPWSVAPSASAVRPRTRGGDVGPRPRRRARAPATSAHASPRGACSARSRLGPRGGGREPPPDAARPLVVVTPPIS